MNRNMRLFLCLNLLIFFPMIALAQDAQTQLQNLSASIRHAERQTSKIDKKVVQLNDEIDKLEISIQSTFYEATRQLHLYYALEKSPKKLSFLLPDTSFQDYHHALRTQESTKNILLHQLSKHNGQLLAFNEKKELIRNYIHEKDTLYLSVQSLLQQVKNSNKKRPSSPQIQEKLLALQAKHNDLNMFLSELIDVPLFSYQTSSPPIFSMPTSGIITQQDNGIAIKTAVGSLVSTPAAGRVLFSGVFKNLGKIVIIDHGHGYRSILRGLKDVYVESGFILNTNEPIGIIDGDGWNKDRNNAILYYELRYNNKSINPIKKITGL